LPAEPPRLIIGSAGKASVRSGRLSSNVRPQKHAVSLQNRSSGKLLGDAGEHYALAQLSFAGKYAAKMPDNWEAYDLAVESGSGLVRVSVKTRSESEGWKTSRWFNFDDRKDCDWIIFIFKASSGSIRSWILPYAVAKQHANKPGPDRKFPSARDVSWRKLNTLPLLAYENNWSLNADPSPPPAPSPRPEA
jgi:hypothetical protein